MSINLDWYGKKLCNWYFFSCTFLVMRDLNENLSMNEVLYVLVMLGIEPYKS